MNFFLPLSIFDSQQAAMIGSDETDALIQMPTGVNLLLPTNCTGQNAPSPSLEETRELDKSRQHCRLDLGLAMAGGSLQQQLTARELEALIPRHRSDRLAIACYDGC